MSSPTFSLASPTSSASSSTEHFLSLPPQRRKPRVSAEHTLNRVRENQRRHRARRKDYIASLEEKLADAEKQLAEARAEIAELRREREMGVAEVIRPLFCDHEDEGSAQERSLEKDTRNDSVVNVREDSGRREDQNGMNVDAMIPAPSATAPTSTLPTEMRTMAFLADLSTYMASTLPLSETSPPAVSIGPPPCCEDNPTSPTRTPTPSPECSTCHSRPAPLPTESTTLCAQAYAMIQQQNFRGIDAATIRLWLYQGYRRAQREGEGCRVENGALFRLLDYISGV